MRISKSDIADLLPVVLVILGIIVVLLIVLLIVRYAAKTADQRKPRQQLYGRVIEKSRRTIATGAGLPMPDETWVCIEMVDMQRINLKLNDENLPICIGDMGVFEYGGQTLFNFSRQV